MRQVRRYMPDSARLAFDVEQRHATLSGCIKLENLRSAKTVLEGSPHFGRKAVTAGNSDAVPDLAIATRRVQQITAKLSDVLEHGAVPAHNVVPELTG